jgi:hypothetical protein
MGSLGSLQGKKSPCRRFFGVLRAKRNKLLDATGGAAGGRKNTGGFYGTLF